ncbi:hypothetical protein B0H14DRAFT_2635661 [Mycena olivaceomarginata]|nr:hypothetical protein B0H14DRAFT_2635661 [Mycena olivaceomarginata]
MVCLGWWSSQRSFSQFGLKSCTTPRQSYPLTIGAAVLRYPFISDPRRTEASTDEDLLVLIDFLARRAALAQHSTSAGRGEFELARQGRSWTVGIKVVRWIFGLYEADGPIAIATKMANFTVQIFPYKFS